MNKRQNLTPKKGAKAKSKPKTANPVGRLANVGWEDIFLKSLADLGNVSAACKKAKVSRDAAYDKKKLDEGFAQAWKVALKTAVESLEAEAWKRARDGVKENVYQMGGKVGTVTKYSDTLLIFLLKAHKKKYRDTARIEHTGKNGGKIQHAVAPDMSELTDGQVDGILGGFIVALTPPTFKTQPPNPNTEQQTNNDQSTDTSPNE